MNASHSHEDRFSLYLKALGSNYTAFVINVGMYALTVPFLLHWLGTERYGLWLIFLQLTSWVLFATTWTAAPIARNAAACYVSRDEQQTQHVFQTCFGHYLGCGLGVVVLTLCSYPLLLRFFQIPLTQQTDAVGALILLSLYMVAFMQLNLLYSMLIGFQRMHIANLLLGTPAALGTGLGLIMLSRGWGLTGLAAGHVVISIILYWIGWHATRTLSGVTLGLRHFDRTLLWSLLRSGSSYFGYNLSYLLLQSDILLVGIILGPVVAATYGIAYKLMDYLVQLIWKIPDSLFPTVTELDLRERGKSLRVVHLVSGKLTMAVAFLLATTLALYGHLGLSLWLGPSNTVPQQIFIAFAVIVVLQVFVRSSLAISYGTNRMEAIARVALAEGALKVTLALCLLPWLGIMGIAISTIVALLSLTAWYVPYKACQVTGDTLWSYFSQSILPVLPAIVVVMLLGGLTLFLITDVQAQVLLGAPLTLIIAATLSFYVCLSTDERQWLADNFQSIPAWQKLVATRREV